MKTFFTNLTPDNVDLVFLLFYHGLLSFCVNIYLFSVRASRKLSLINVRRLARKKFIKFKNSTFIYFKHIIRCVSEESKPNLLMFSINSDIEKLLCDTRIFVLFRTRNY